MNERVYLVGTFDTKGAELAYLREQIRAGGAPVLTVDVSTSRAAADAADVGAAEVADAHPGGAAAVFTADRGAAVAAMTLAFTRFMAARRDIGAILGVGGSGGTAISLPPCRRFPWGCPSSWCRRWPAATSHAMSASRTSP